MVIGTTAVDIKFTIQSKSEKAKNYIQFILDITLRLVTQFILNSTMETQATIVGLCRNASKEYMQQIDFLGILNGLSTVIFVLQVQKKAIPQVVENLPASDSAPNLAPVPAAGD